MHRLKFANSTPSYERLLDAIQKRARPVVAWIGAGASVPAGLPSWSMLRADLEKELKAVVDATVGAKKRELIGKLAEIRKQLDPWKAFGMLQNALGEATFRASIRQKLLPALKVPIPELYTRLWGIPIDGIISLNIDRLAQRSLTTVRPGESFVERHGRAVTTLLGRVTQDRFIANLHGFFEDPSTWVFTDLERSELLKDARYHEFVRDCAKYCTIVLLGISADDSAVLDHFRHATIDGIPLDTHYWLTDREDIPAEVEKYGISVVHYANADGMHSELLNFAVDASKAILQDPSPPVVSVSAGSSHAPLSPSDIIALAPNEIRRQLNAEAARILSANSEDGYAEFEDFCKRYARAILNAGYVSNDASEGADRILEYQVSDTSEDKEGAFGKVWRANDSDGNLVALKIFRYEVREKPGLLRAFRRGIRSLQILSSHSLPGIVGFKAASEIPPVLVMEWVDGVDLQEAVATGMLKEWSVRTRIARDLARTIFSAHNVPERVLHRDIRPANVMLREFFSNPEGAEVVVLDFDLSWHIGSLEQSVLAGSGSSYLAPEQFAAIKGATSRSAAVDSFGFGMTLFFLLSAHEPSSAFKSDWKDTIARAVGQQRCKEWRSLPARLARLIESCTTIDQNRRPLFSQIVYEVGVAFEAVSDPESVTDMAFLAEEVLARAPEMAGYEADEGATFIRRSPSGIQVSLGASKSSDFMLSLRIAFQQTGTERYQNLAAIGDYFKRIMERLVANEFVSKNASRGLSLSAGNYVLDVDVSVQGYRAFQKFCEVFEEVTTRLSAIVGRS